MEYVILMIILLTVLYVMKDVISRGVFGRYKQAGDVFGFGRQYDSKRTVVCKTDVAYDLTSGQPTNSEVTYDEGCYQSKVMRPLSRLASPSGIKVWDTSGGCPQCNPGFDDVSKACFICEDEIKQSCLNTYCNS